MKLIITEKQLQSLINNEVEVDEQETSEPASEPSSPSSGGGATDSSSGGSYPDVTTWDEIVGSKLTRGPANPVGNGKMSDRVKRDGPANQLN